MYQHLLVYKHVQFLWELEICLYRRNVRDFFNSIIIILYK
jgi:hypothetical protein